MTSVNTFTCVPAGKLRNSIFTCLDLVSGILEILIVSTYLLTGPALVYCASLTILYIMLIVSILLKLFLTTHLLSWLIQAKLPNTVVGDAISLQMHRQKHSIGMYHVLDKRHKSLKNYITRFSFFPAVLRLLNRPRMSLGVVPIFQFISLQSLNLFYLYFL